MKNRAILAVGLALVLFTGLFNVGIIAIDDYNNGFAEMIPAQNARPFSAILQSGIHPVLPRAFFSVLARTAYGLGVNDPIWQLRLSLAWLGLLVFGLNIWATRRLFSQWKDPFALQVAYFLIACYFAMPLFSTRPMIETAAMPFLTLSAVFAADYARASKLKYLLIAAALLAFASLLRFQSGVCGLALVVLVARRRSWRDAAALGIASIVLFFLTGLLDYFAQGRFHGQLYNYFVYCLRAGEIFGKMPFYTFLLLAFALTLPPTFLSAYPGFDWKKQYRPLLAPALYFFAFLFTHSLSPHKEERFLVPVLPLLLFLLVPLAVYLWKKGGAWRRYWFLGVNGVLLFFVCTNIPQNNLITLARWIHQHPSIARVDGLDKAIVIRPQAFILRPIEWNDATAADYSNRECGRLAVLRWDAVPNENWAASYRKVARFEPGILETILVWANPQNARRGPLDAYLPIDCPDPTF